MSKYMSWIAKTFANPEELMIALLQGEKWKYSGTVFSYRDFKFYAGSMLINSLQSMEILCDNKTLWTKVEEKTELDLMKEKYASGDYIKNDPKKFETKVFIDRNKLLDEAIFLAICGLEQIRKEMFITGKVRLEIARAKLDEALQRLERDGY